MPLYTWNVDDFRSLEEVAAVMPSKTPGSTGDPFGHRAWPA